MFIFIYPILLLLLSTVTTVTPFSSLQEQSKLHTIMLQEQSISLIGLTPFFGRTPKEIGLLAQPQTYQDIVATLNHPKLHDSANGAQLANAIIAVTDNSTDSESLWYSLAHACMCVHSLQHGTRSLPYLYEQAWLSLNDRIPSMVYSVIFSGIGGAIVGALNNRQQPLTGARIGASSAAITTGMIAITLAVLSHITRFHFKTMIALTRENLRHLLITYYEHLPPTLCSNLVTLFEHLAVNDEVEKSKKALKQHNELLAFYRLVRKQSEITSF